MFKFLCFFFICFIYFKTNAQQFILKGNIKDSLNNPIAFAQIILKKKEDNKTFSYTTSNRDGYYTLENIPPETYILSIGFLGYANQQKEIILNSNIQSDFNLIPNVKKLQEVIIKSKPIAAKVKQDTIRYNLAAAINGKEEVLKDILSKLPGVSVDENGKIKANGKAIDKLLVDGEDFFSGKSQMATRNLPADMVGGVELLNNYNDFSVQKGTKSGTTAMNIIIKEDKRGRLVGNVSGLGGIKNKYLTHSNLFNLGKKLKYSFIGDINNTGEEVFTIYDYIEFMGGIAALEQNKTAGGANTASYRIKDTPLINVNNDYKGKSTTFAALNLNFRVSEKLRLNGFVIGGRNKINTIEQLQRNYLQPQTTIVNSQNGVDDFLFGNSYINLDYQPKENQVLTYKGSFSFIDRDKQLSIKNINGTTINNLESFTKTNSYTIEQNLTYINRIADKHILQLNAFFKTTPNITPYNLTTNLPPFQLPLSNTEAQLQQQYHENQQSLKINASINLKYSNSWSQNIVAGIFQNNQALLSSLGEKTADEIFIPFDPNSYYNDLHYKTTSYVLNNNFNKTFKKFSINTGAYLVLYNNIISNKNANKINNNKTKLIPYTSVTFKIGNQQTFQLSLNNGIALTEKDALIKNVVLNDYNSLQTSSTINNLYSSNNSFSFYYFFFNPQANTSISTNFSYVVKHNPITINTKFTSNLVMLKNYITSKNTSGTSGFIFFDKGFGFAPIKLKINLTYTANDYYDFVNNLENQINNKNFDLESQLTTNYKTQLNAELGFKGQRGVNKNISFNTKNQYFNFKPHIKINYDLSENLLINTRFEYAHFSAITMSRSLSLLDFEIKYTLKKRKLDLYAIGTNLLNLNKTERLTADYQESYYQERIYATLPGLVGIKLKYNL